MPEYKPGDKVSWHGAGPFFVGVTGTGGRSIGLIPPDGRFVYLSEETIAPWPEPDEEWVKVPGAVWCETCSGGFESEGSHTHPLTSLYIRRPVHHHTFNQCKCGEVASDD